MKINVSSQYAGESALYQEINRLLKENKHDLFRVLVAYTSIGGLKIIEDELFSFLQKKNRIDWILGIEKGVTSKEVLQYLLFLKKRFPKYVSIRIFTAGNDNDLFHPKVYLLSNKDNYNIFIGSNNLTIGGLMSNFESSALLDLDLKNTDDKKIIHEFEIMWQKYSTPAPPLKSENLIELTESTINSINDQDIKEKRDIQQTLNKFKHPFSDVNKHKEIVENIKRLHHEIIKKSRKTITQRTKIKIAKGQPTQLIMDILQETRETQVQLPTDVLEPFFGIKDPAKKTEIILSQILNGNIIRTDVRPFIIQKNKTNRLEIAGIKGLPRPLITKFTRNTDGTYDHEIITQSSPDYEALNKLLEESGTRKRKESRRWVLVS